MTTTELSAVRVRGLTKSFPGVAALRNVDLDIYKGEVHGLVGENGAGKSTSHQALNGHLRRGSGFDRAVRSPVGARWCASGTASRDRRDLSRAGDSSRTYCRSQRFPGQTRDLGPLSTDAPVLDAFTSWPIALASRLTQMRSPDRCRSPVNSCLRSCARSGRNTGILIMDEPATSLGEAERERLYVIVDGLRKHGLSILFISHDLDDVLRLCDRVSVMRDGAMVAIRPVRDWDRSHRYRPCLATSI